MGDWSRDNPAGRLHTLLVKLQDQAIGQPLAQAWSNVLGTAGGNDFQLVLAEVSKLVPHVQQAVTAMGSRGNAAQVERYRAVWSNPIFPQDRPFLDPVQHFRLPQEALDALASVAEYLHQAAPEAMPTEDAKLDELRAQVDDLIQGMEEAEDLPDIVKLQILDRLHDVVRALSHLDIGGPDAVKHATEALAGAIDLGAPQAFWRSPIAAKARAVVTALWLAFTAPAAVHDGLPVWEHSIRELMPASAQVRSSDRNGERVGSRDQKALPPPGTKE